MNKLIRRYGFILLIIFIGLVIWSLRPPGSEIEVDHEAASSKIEKSNEKTIPDSSEENGIKVDVKGEVNQPGVYEVKSEMRVDDVIQLAGGMTDKADPSSVNLAQKLIDEMVIHVYSSESVTSDGASEKPRIPNSNDQVVLNQATVEEIQTLNGIGPSKAEAIIQYRQENGPFKTVEDLVNVSGIGEKTIENIKEDIRVP
ncbi:helix-hairpin-helix domain-containing protein [Halobacillus mangrovi]|uniref:helix-hairpin-helix domain-containing protein n=1 Tax=Halobacillus mangrovi TaxID=402384 RepID=UPI003D980265